MNIGDKVTATNRLVKQRNWVNGRQVVSWIISPSAQPVSQAIFLGRTLLYTGYVVPGDEYDPSEFHATEQMAAWVLQPLSGSRYRRPVYVLPEDVEAQP